MPRGKRMRSPGGYEMQSRCCAATCVRRAGTRWCRGAAGGCDAQGRAHRRGRATEKKASHRLSLSLLSLPAVLHRVSLRALALFLSLLLFLSVPIAEGHESLSRAAFLPAQNPSHAGFVSRSGISVPAQAPRPLPRAAD